MIMETVVFEFIAGNPQQISHHSNKFGWVLIMSAMENAQMNTFAEKIAMCQSWNLDMLSFLKKYKT